MRLLFVADGRSPTSRNWIRYWIERGDEVFLASTFACDPLPGLTGMAVIPAALSGYPRAGGADRFPARERDARFIRLRQTIRHWLGPLFLPHEARRLRQWAEQVKPDLVHAMRIPYEGMLAANAGLEVPLIVSVWGNDFTLHAPSTPWMRHHTRWTMRIADGLHADCERDIRLARQWGLDPDKPTLVAPGNGGIRTEIFFPPAQPVEQPVVLNPRGFRAYVRNDTFFRAIPLVQKEVPTARFLCAAMAGQPEALQWVNRLRIADVVELLPVRPHAEMAALYRQAQVLVSPAIHDGTPNTLLEGMACGCFPVAGDLESIREWIRDGENGLLVDAGDAQALARAIVRALRERDLRQRAADRNIRLVMERADYRRSMKRAEAFYQAVRG